VYCFSETQCSSWLQDKNIFGYECTLQRYIFLVNCRVLCAKVVGPTSSEGILVVTVFECVHCVVSGALC